MAISSAVYILIKQTQPNDEPFASVWISLLCFIIFVVIVLLSSLRISREHQRLVIFRLGRSVGVRGPGLILIIPFIERGVIVELGEQIRDMHLIVPTHEGAFAKLDIEWTYQVVDPEKTLLTVENLENAAGSLINTTIRNSVTDMFISEVVHNRRLLEVETEANLSQQLSMWGAKLIRLEIKDIHRG